MCAVCVLCAAGGMLSDTPSERIPPQRGYPLRENNPSERVPPQREYPSERIPPQREYPLRENTPSERITPQREYPLTPSTFLRELIRSLAGGGGSSSSAHRHLLPTPPAPLALRGLERSLRNPGANHAFVACQQFDEAEVATDGKAQARRKRQTLLDEIGVLVFVHEAVKPSRTRETALQAS